MWQVSNNTVIKPNFCFISPNLLLLLHPSSYSKVTGTGFFCTGKLILLHLFQHIMPQIKLASSSDTQKSCGCTKLLHCQPTTWRNFPKSLAMKVMGDPQLHKVPFQQQPSPQMQLILLTYSWLPPWHRWNKKLSLICLFFGKWSYSARPGISRKGMMLLGRTILHDRLQRHQTHTFAQKLSCLHISVSLPKSDSVSGHPFVRWCHSTVQNLETAAR